MADQKKVLFIGSFILPKNGSFGGVYFASTTIKGSLNQMGIDVIELDTTLDDINQTDVASRIPKILKRNLFFISKIIFNSKAKSLLVFLSAGNSYIDKLPAIMMAKLLRKKIIILPVSGLIINDLKKSVYKKAVGLVMRLADTIVCQSDYWKNFFTENVIGGRKLVVVENWVPNKTIEQSHYLSFPVFEKKTDVFRMVYISRLEIAKGVDDLIKLALNLKDKIEFKIDVFGEGSYKAQFQAMIEKYNLQKWIELKRWLNNDEIQLVANTYHVALFTSRFEGYPNALLDFIFSKVPIVATNIPSVMAVGKNHALYYEPANIDQFAEKVLWCRENYKDALGMSATLINEKYQYNNISFSTKKIIKLLH